MRRRRKAGATKTAPELRDAHKTPAPFSRKVTKKLSIPIGPSSIRVNTVTISGVME